MDSFGLVTVKFNKPMKIPENYESFDSSILDIIVVGNSNEANLTYTWKIIDFIGDEMKIQMQFSDPLFVSSQ